MNVRGAEENDDSRWLGQVMAWAQGQAQARERWRSHSPEPQPGYSARTPLYRDSYRYTSGVLAGGRRGPHYTLYVDGTEHV
jgi:hypothetical protein